MALIIYTTSYGSPGDVEHQFVSKPSTLTEFYEEAKTAKESKGGFLKCTTNPRTSKTGTATSNEILINLEQVEWVIEGE